MALVLVAFALLASSAHAEEWRWPVRGEVARSFTLGSDPYARGRHRGIDIEVPPGTPVRAACAGRVRFAGRVPRYGRTVSTRCGGFVVTYLHLSSLAVRGGRRLAGGDRLGVGGPRLHFGVRRATARHAYIDPLSMLPSAGPGSSPPPPLLPSEWRRGRPARVPPASAPARRPAALPARRPAAAPGGTLGSARDRLPIVVWAGVGLLALAVPGLAVVSARRRRGRRPTSERVAAAPVRW